MRLNLKLRAIITFAAVQYTVYTVSQKNCVNVAFLNNSVKH